ncbi:hypothetical protein CK203_029151 [Vitis vinifera]|uniref:Retrovirus-related Pol polyprotein from transposon TNT 1-94-like beta-barrel domain-containing protein n=1 Tax=Vitis vinifera TaxID=29760 RepID=A0A438ISR4_VITVI|nr:hypothetical protein CK203_029151 [Vitis vinifera]
MTVFHFGHLLHLPKLCGQPYRGQKTLITVNIFPTIFSKDFFSPAIFSNTDHIIRSAKRRSATFLKAPEPKTDPRASHAPFFSGSLNPMRRRVAHFLVPSFYQQARPALSCTSKPPSVLSDPASPFFWHFSLRRQLSSLAKTCVCLGKASSSSPVTFLLCLGPDIPGSSSTAVIKPPFRALFRSKRDSISVRIISPGQRPWNSGLWDKVYEDHLVTPKDVIPDVDKILSLSKIRFLLVPSVPSLDDVFARLLLAIGVKDNVLSAPIVISLGHTQDRCYQLHGRLLALPTLLSQPILCYLDLTPLRAPHLKLSPLLSPFLGPWILDSGASDHISGNKHLFSSITTTSALPTVTLANGSQTMAKGIGLAHPLPSLPLHSVLYAPETHSTRKTIGIGRDFKPLSPHITFISCSLHFSLSLSTTFMDFPKATWSSRKEILIHNGTDSWAGGL